MQLKISQQIITRRKEVLDATKLILNTTIIQHIFTIPYIYIYTHTHTTKGAEHSVEGYNQLYPTKDHLESYLSPCELFQHHPPYKKPCSLIAMT